jgi:4-amino-4-deoxy-L-arabinose transferase-like glycosyltransferase
MKSPLTSDGIPMRVDIQLPWHHMAIILLPWLAVAAAFGWMTMAFPTFHGSDETLFHYPAIQRFFAELPYPDIRDYSSATSPLFHVLFAFAAKVVGLSLQSLRLLNIAVSLTAVFVFYGLIARTAPRNEALLFTLLFGLSPYFFGASFLVLTDNLGILFALLAIRALYRSWESPEVRHWIVFCVWVCLAALTRQLYAWLAVGAVLTMFLRKEPLRTGGLKTAGLAVAGLPLAALVLVWGGLTPPTFQEQHVASSVINPRAGVFAMSVFGLYWVALFPDRFIHALRQMRGQDWLPLAIILAVTVMTLLLIPLSPQEGDNGIVWRVSRVAPELMGTRIVFWLLFPIGLMFFWRGLRSKDMVSSGTALMAFAFLVCNLPNAMVFQKYFDPLTIAFVVLIEARAQAAGGVATGRLAKLSRPLLLCAFVAYPFISWRFFNSA